MKALSIALFLVLTGCGSADNDPQLDCTTAREGTGAIAATIAAACDQLPGAPTPQNYGPLRE